MSENGSIGPAPGASTLPSDPHEEFRELCAVATTGELTPAEWTRLNRHLDRCRVCRKLMEQYVSIIGTALPALAAEAVLPEEGHSSGSWSLEDAEAALMETLEREPGQARAMTAAPLRPERWKVAWKYAAAAVVLVSVSFASFATGTLLGRRRGATAAPLALRSVHPSASSSPRQVDAGSSQTAMQASEKDQIDRLRHQLSEREHDSARLKEQLRQLDTKLVTQTAALDQSRAEREQLASELAQSQQQAQSSEARLTAFGEQTAEDTRDLLGLKIRIADLNTALRNKDQQIAHDEKLLERDRDIRNVIGARNLYIAEIYDVAKNGDTQKPFGRVFYTKDKSLIFYAYDLDQQHRVKKDTAFQAWGRRGSGRRRDISLGLLYEDDAQKKRWVLKVNDAKTISEIDAIFVTVEPDGGSAKPSGKPLLFTYLRLDPNHP